MKTNPSFGDARQGKECGTEGGKMSFQNLPTELPSCSPGKLHGFLGFRPDDQSGNRRVTPEAALDPAGGGRGGNEEAMIGQAAPGPWKLPSGGGGLSYPRTQRDGERSASE